MEKRRKKNKTKIIKKDNAEKKILKQNDNKSKIELNYIIAETISKIIIDKIIANVVLISRNNDIDKKSFNYYYNYINDLIDPLISMRFFYHENNSNNNIQSNILYNNKESPLNTNNTWIEISEPSSSSIDRFESSQIISNTFNKNDNQFSNKFNFPLIFRQINELIEFKKRNSDAKIIKKFKKNKIHKIIKLNEKIQADNINVKKLLKKEIPSMAYCDLEKEKYENYFSNEKLNEFLRKEKRYKEILKAEQNKNQIQNIILEKQKKLIKNNNIVSNNQSFDSKGKIIRRQIYKFNINNLSKDFNIIDVKIKNSKLINSYTNILEQKENDNIKKRNTSKGVSKNSKTNDNNNKTKINNDIKDNNNKNNGNKKNNDKKANNDNNIIIIHNNDKDNINNEEIKSGEINDNKIKNIIIGNNSYINIKPEIGVVVKGQEDAYIKEGGNSYLLKYNKPSINDFNNILYQTSLLNSKHYSSSNNFSEISKINLTSNNNNISNNNNTVIKTEIGIYNGYNQSFTEKNNPLIQNAISPSFQNNKIKRRNNNLNMSLNKSNYTDDKIFRKSNSSIGFNEDNLFLNDMSNQNKIKLSDLAKNRSLFNLINDSEDFGENKNIIINSVNKKIDNIISGKKINSYNDKIFPLININNRNSENKNKVNNQKIINKFNYRIMINKNWGKVNEVNDSYFIESDLIENNFRKQKISNKIKIINENRFRNLNTRKRNINF